MREGLHMETLPEVRSGRMIVAQHFECWDPQGQTEF